MFIWRLPMIVLPLAHDPLQKIGFDIGRIGKDVIGEITEFAVLKRKRQHAY
jgi:hypothetical protein